MLERLSNALGVSGHEGAVRRLIREATAKAAHRNMRKEHARVTAEATAAIGETWEDRLCWND